MSSRTAYLGLLAVGLLSLAVELDRASKSALITMATFAAVWLVRRRLLRRQHRHSSRLYRLRREVVTNAVLTMLLVTLASLVLAAMDVSADLLPSAAAKAAAGQTPWAETFLLDGFLTVLGLSWTALGTFGMRRRALRRRHPASPPAPLAG